MEEYEIDLDEFQEQDSEVLNKFAQDFKKEIEYLEFNKQFNSNQDKSKFSKETRIEAEIINKEKNSCNANLKSVHREIVKKLHPDVAGLDREEEFKQFQKSWEEGNTHEILNVAVKENVMEALEPSSIDELEKFMEDQNKKLENQRKNLRWGWHHSSKDNLARNRVRKMLGINPNDFQIWVQGNSVSEKETELITKDCRLISTGTLE